MNRPTVQPIEVGILIFPGFPMSCLTSCIEPLRAANEITGTDAFRWAVVSETPDPVAASAGVSFSPDMTLAEVKSLDFLFFASSPAGRFEAPAVAGAALQRVLRNNGRLGAFSAGIFPLAATGLTGTHPVSLHWCYERAFRTTFPDIPTRDSLICDAGPFVTASGASAVFDLMLDLIETRVGGDVMTEVACWFQHPVVRGSAITQKIPAYSTAKSADLLPKQLEKAIRLFAANIDAPLRVGDIADQVGLSSRTLERRFKRALGQSPMQYFRTMRMKQARQLVLYSNTSIGEIAQLVGYAAPGVFSRHYRDSFGVSPAMDRNSKTSLRIGDGDFLPPELSLGQVL